MAEEKTTFPWTPGQNLLVDISVVIVFLAFLLSLTSPIPTGEKGRKEAPSFLKEHFPNLAVSPGQRRSEPVAVIFHLIRSGSAEVVREAIDFAAEQEFGYAAPYVIERLGSDNPELERSAQFFLRRIAEGNYGPSRESWRAWWQNPPRNLYGVTVRQNTFAIAIPIVVALGGVLVIVIGQLLGRSKTLELGSYFLGISWFMVFILIMKQFEGGSHTCFFGSTSITYFVHDGAVLGLEDYRVVGFGFVAMVIAGFVLVPIFLVIGYFIFFAPQKKPEALSPITYQHKKETNLW